MSRPPRDWKSHFSHRTNIMYYGKPPTIHPLDRFSTLSMIGAMRRSPGPGSRKKARGFAISLSTVAIVLGSCCVFTLMASFLNVSVLMDDSNNSSNGSNDMIPSSGSTVISPMNAKQLSRIDAALFGAGGAGAGTAGGESILALSNITQNKRVGHLLCQDYGGPMDVKGTQEMVYWQDIPQDEEFVSPLWDAHNPKFITFEPDRGGFNNIRMAMETALALAIAMGRILVLPPDQPMYLLNKVSESGHGQTTKRAFGFQDFFPMQEMANHIKGLHIMTMQEFLEQQALQGKLRSVETGKVALPPGNRTQWDGRIDVAFKLEPYLRDVGFSPPDWDPLNCMAAFPARPGDDKTLTNLFHEITVTDGGFPPFETYVGRPTSVHASTKERWMEQQNAQRGSQLCLYDTKLQNQPVIHFAGKKGLSGGRLLTHFYTFLFFEDWKTDLWMKRFVRDHVRYKNEIQCAAARIVQAIRQHVQKRLSTSKIDGDHNNAPFDAFHVRRGDFQYKRTRVSAQVMYEMAKSQIPEGSTVYMATDERDRSFFAPLAAHYDLLFLSDFQSEIPGMNPNFFGMLDQLVAARSRTFFGCWFSTFTGYINRLRGYDSDLYKRPGFAHGILNSYYYAIEDKKDRMREYWPISGAHYAREFPISWRNIDHGILATAGDFVTLMPKNRTQNMTHDTK